MEDSLFKLLLGLFFFGRIFDVLEDLIFHGLRLPFLMIYETPHPPLSQRGEGG